MNTKVKKVLSRIGLILLIIIVVALGIRSIFNYTTGKKLEVYLEKARADGVIVSLKDLAPRCDDSDNAALLWKAAQALVIVPDAQALGSINRTVEDFFYARTLPEESRKKLTELVGRNRRALELMLEASGRPCYRLGDWTKPSPAVEPATAVKMIQATRLLGIDAVLRADAGQVNEGLGQCRQGMLFLRTTLDEPFLINNLVALACIKTLLVCFNRIVTGSNMDSATLAAWIKEMDSEAWRIKFWRCIQVERVLGLETALHAIKGDREALREMETEGNQFFYWLIRPLLKSGIIWMQNQYRDLEKNIGLPYSEIKKSLREFQQTRQSLPWYYKLSGVLFPDFQSVFLKEATLEAMMLTTKAGLACKIYKIQTGHYPESLAALVPDLLDKEPIDPFTGKPIIYRLQDGGIIIYSVGSNEKDDGGRGTYQITQLVMEKDDDWAWSEKRLN